MKPTSLLAGAVMLSAALAAAEDRTAVSKQLWERLEEAIH
jgi:hypothetical protein